MSGTLTITAKPQSGSFDSSVSLQLQRHSKHFELFVLSRRHHAGSGTARFHSYGFRDDSGGCESASRCLSFLPSTSVGLLPFGLLGLGFSRKGPRKRGVQPLALGAVIGLGMFGTSCGGGKTAPTNSSAASNPTSCSVTINGNTSVSRLSTVVNILLR